MRIKKNLNLVIPVDSAEGTAYVHSTPVSIEVFEDNFMVLSKTFANMFANGLGAIAGPRVAFLMLKSTAMDLGSWDKVNREFVQEMVRLSNVAIPTDQGYKQVPLHTAIEKQIIGDDDIRDVMGQLSFFTLVWLLNKPAQVEPIMSIVSGLWESQITSSNFTEFVNSLQTSTEVENTGETVKTSSVPS